MSSERQILKRLLEGVEDYEEPCQGEPCEEGCKSKDLNESEFTTGGKTYKCVFGKYYCDGEEITKEDYMKAKEGNPSNVQDGENADSGISKRSYDEYKPEDFDDDLEGIESSIDDIASKLKGTYYEDRDEYLSKLGKLDIILSNMEDYVSDEQYKRIEKLRSTISRAEDIEYEGPSDRRSDPYYNRGLNPEDFD